MLTGGFMWLTSGLTHLLDSAISALTDAQLFAAAQLRVAARSAGC